MARAPVLKRMTITEPLPVDGWGPDQTLPDDWTPQPGQPLPLDARYRPRSRRQAWRGVADHEAGHAVAAILLGQPLAWAIVRPPRPFLHWPEGRVEMEKRRYGVTTWYLAALQLMEMAGPVAETRGPGEARPWSAAFHEHAMLRVSLDRLPDRPRAQHEAWIHEARTLAETHLTTAWPAVVAVALELLKHRGTPVPGDRLCTLVLAALAWDGTVERCEPSSGGTNESYTGRPHTGPAGPSWWIRCAGPCRHLLTQPPGAPCR